MALPRALVRAVARAKPLVPDGAWPVLLATRSLLGQRPVIGLPHAKRVLVVAAHPDDEVIGCGGTVRLLADAGATITAVYATSGDASIGSDRTAEELAELREAEARAGAAVIGATRTTFLRLPDGGLADRSDDLVAALTTVIDAEAPDVVLAPWRWDDHPDHRAIMAALCSSGLPDDLEVWTYECWTPLPANRLVDVTAVADVRERALAEHATAAQAFDLSAMLALGRYRSVHGLMGNGVAEAFLAGTLAEHRGLEDGSAP